MTLLDVLKHCLQDIFLYYRKIKTILYINAMRKIFIRYGAEVKILF